MTDPMSTDSKGAAVDIEPTGAERKIIGDIVEETIQLAIVRHGLEWDEALEISEAAICEDVANCLVGDEYGCADPSDPKDMRLIYRHILALRAYASEVRRSALLEARDEMIKWSKWAYGEKLGPISDVALAAETLAALAEKG